jgi:hypothetical protein
MALQSVRYAKRPMRKPWNRQHLVAPDRERAVEHERPELRHVLVSRLRAGERVGEDPLQVADGARVPVEGDRRPLQRVVAAQLVEAEDVVGVAVGEEHRIHADETEPQRLRPQVRRRIHQHRQPIVEPQRDRRAPACVAGVGRQADAARAADHGHSHGRAGAQKQDLHADEGLAAPRAAPRRPGGTRRPAALTGCTTTLRA